MLILNFKMIFMRKIDEINFFRLLFLMELKVKFAVENVLYWLNYGLD